MMKAFKHIVIALYFGFTVANESLAVQATSIVAAEYFYDTDPGVGMATALSITPGATLSELPAVSTSGLSAGFHRLYVRVKDDAGLWSLHSAQTFYVEATAAATSATVVNSAEYFFDTDPGVGAGTALTITNGASLNEAQSISVGGLAAGFHRMYIRVKDDAGLWSLHSAQTFYVEATAAGTSATVVNAAEYFFDTDPGIGSGTSLAITSGSSLDEVLAVPLGGLSVGTHNLFFRIQDDSGNWSLTQGQSFTVTLEDGMVGYYVFNGDVTDQSGNGNNGALGDGSTTSTFPSQTSDRNEIGSRAYGFDGVDDYIEIPASNSLPDNLDSFTITAWVKTGATEGNIVARRNTATDRFFLNIWEGKALFEIRENANTSQAISTATINDDQWHFVAATRNQANGTISIYWDGVHSVTETDISGSIGTGASVYIGGHFDPNSSTISDHLGGNIDEVRIYSKALTADEILNIYDSENLGLVGHYTFNNDVNDQSGYDNHGNINGGVTYVSDRFTMANNAANFNGTDSNIQFGNETQPTQELSYVVWFKTTAANVPILNGGIPISTTVTGYALFVQVDGKVVADLELDGASGWDVQINSDNAVNDGKWHQAIFTYDGSNTYLYIDGVLQAETATVSGTISYDGSPTLMGSFSNSHFYTGQIDDVQIYARGLSTSEVSAIHDQERADLVGHYAFNGDATDNSSFGNDGTPNGNPTLTADRLAVNDMAYEFDGNDDFIELPFNAQSLGNEFTISAWVYRTKSNGTNVNQGIVSNDVNLTDRGIMFGIIGGSGNDAINASFRNDLGDAFIVTGNTVPLSTWKHFVVTYDGGNLRLYEDGELVGTPVSANGDIAGTTNFQIGHDPFDADAGRYFGGKIDEVRIYNKALSDSEISSLSESGIPNITSFSPSSGPIGTSVTITGSNFDANTQNNVVFFGATKATIISASQTELTVTVPVGATYEPITVTTNELVAYSKTPFVVTFTDGVALNVNSFDSKADYPTGLEPYSVFIDDLDGDGKADLVVANKLGNSVSVLRNSSPAEGTIGFDNKLDFPTGLQPFTVIAEDLNGDGKKELIATNEGSNTVSVFENISSGSGNISFGARADFTTGAGPFSVAVGDLDLDGKADLVVVNDASNTISILRNNNIGDGTISFEDKIDLATETTPRRLAIGDLDGDGMNDIAVTNEGSGSISLFRNTTTATGQIAFNTETSLASNTNPESVAIGDLDGDGQADLGVTNWGSDNISIFRNISSGPGNISFDNKLDFTSGEDPEIISIGDLDGDGKVDLAATNSNSASVSVFRNVSPGIGTIGFNEKVDFATGLIPYSVAIGDLDGDGKPDLATANNGSNTVSVFKNIGVDALTAHYTFNAGDATDDTGNGRDGAAVGNVTYGNGMIDQAAVFDNTGSYLELANSNVLLDGATDFTVSGWIKTQNRGYIAIKHEFGTGNGFWLQVHDGLPNFYVEYGEVAQSEQPIGDDQWHMLTGVYSNNSLYLYVDGQLKQTRLNHGAYATFNNEPVRIGGHPSDFDACSVDEVRIYERALSSDQIASLYGQEKPNQLIGEYLFSGNIDDTSGNGNHGVMSAGLNPVADRNGVENAAYSYDAGDYVITASNGFLNTYEQGSWSIWFSLSQINATQVLMSYNENASSYGALLYIIDNKLQLNLSQPGSQNASSFVGSSTINPNMWYQVIITNDGINPTKMYLNGVLENTTFSDGGTGANGTEWLADLNFSSASHLSIGAFYHNSNAEFGSVGTIDDVRIYSNWLTSAEVSDLYNDQKATMLIGEYLFNGNTDDTSGHGHHGTESGGIIAATDRFGISGRAYAFDGVNDQITLPFTTQAVANEFTITSWVYRTKTNSTTARQGIVSSAVDSNDGGILLGVRGLGENGQSIFTNTDATSYFTFGKHINEGEWTFCATTYDGAELKLFRNSEIVSANPASGTVSGSGNFRIGNNPFFGLEEEFFGGNLDDIKIYAGALTDDQIIDAYQNQKPNFTGNDFTTYFLGRAPNPDDYTFIGVREGNVYYLSTATAVWNEAQTAAEAEGGHLAVIHSEEVNTLIANGITNSGGGSFWIGMSDQDNEGDWTTWADKTLADYQNWADGEPNGGVGENHLEMTGSGLWNDLNDQPLRYVIEIPFFVGSIDASNHTVNLMVENDTDVTQLIATFSLSNEAIANIGNVEQVTGQTANDFTTNLTYTITAEDGTPQDWIVTVEKLPPVSYGLIAYYPFTGDALDESVNGNNLTDNGGIVHTTDRYGDENAAYAFDGTDDYLSANYAMLNDLNGFSMAGWIEATITGSRVGFFGQNDLFEFGYLTDDQINIWSGPDGFSIVHSDENFKGGWHHIVVTGNNDSLTLFIDGAYIKASARTVDGPYGSSIYNFNIGGGGIFDPTDNWFTGKMDEIRIYDVALSRAQVEEIYETEKVGNRPPTAINLDITSISENQAIGTIVGTFSTEDPDSGDSHIYSLVSGAGDTDNSSFTINSNTNQLESAQVFNFENQSSYSIRVRTDDGNGGTFERTFNIDIVDLVESGPVAIYSFDGNREDTSGNADHLSANGTSFGLDRLDQSDMALEFNGSTDYAFTTPQLSLYNQGEISFTTWLKLKNIDKNQDIIEMNQMFLFVNSSNQVVFNVFDASHNGLSDVASSSTTLVVDTWYFLSGSYDGSSLNLYINGVADGQNAISHVLNSNNGQLVIGRGGIITSAENHLDGFIDEFKLYAMALSQEEIIAIYDAEKPPVNSAPQDINLSNQTIDENLASGAVIGTFSTTDPDAGDRHTYALVSGEGDADNSRFTINSSTDELESTAIFDFESRSTYSIRVETNDGNSENNTYQEVFTISVLDAEDAPSFGTPNYATEYTRGGSGADLTIDVTDQDGNLTTVDVLYKVVTSSSYTRVAMSNTSGDTYVINVPDGAFADALGLSFYVEASDGTLTSQTDVQSISVIVAEGEHNVTGLKSSTDSLDYKIISIPYERISVADVFGDFVTENTYGEKWKLLHWGGSSYQEYPGLSHFEPGKGYWFLNNAGNTSISLGSGTSVAVDEDSPFAIDLRNGQNQIGNPFPFDIDWQAVQAHNPNLTIDDDLIGYSTGQWIPLNTLRQFEGAWLSHSMNNSSIEIPLSAITTAGRVADRNTKVSNSGVPGNGNWRFGLNIENGLFTYNVSKVGMDHDALTTSDRFDMHALPRLSSYLDLTFDAVRTRDVVPVAAQYQWNFEINTSAGNQPVTLTWDNQVLQNNEYGLFLVDVELHRLVDMSNSDTYYFKPNGKRHRFELFYGLKSGLQDQIVGKVNFVGDPYPNPFAELLTIPVAITSNNSQLETQLMDVSGRILNSWTTMGLKAGFHHVTINTDDINHQSWQDGIYLIRIVLKSEEDLLVYNKRLIFKK